MIKTEFFFNQLHNFVLTSVKASHSKEEDDSDKIHHSPPIPGSGSTKPVPLKNV